MKTAITLIPLICASCSESVVEIPFDQEKWRSADVDVETRTIRQRMVQDLTRRYSFDGMARHEVVQLLGEPAPGEPSALCFPQWDLIYCLGIERGGDYSLDDEVLGFCFGPDDRVVDWGLSVN